MFTHSSFPSAGPPFRTSLTAIEGSPFAKCGLSRPPDTILMIFFSHLEFFIMQEMESNKFYLQCQIHNLLLCIISLYDIPMMFCHPAM